VRRAAKIGLAALVLAAVAGGALWGAVTWLDGQARAAYRGPGADARLVVVEPGSSVAAIGHRLVEAGVVRDLRTFRWAVWRQGATRRLQAGEYQFDRPLSADAVVEKLARGEVHLWPITFPEGLTINAMAGLYAEAGFGTADAFKAAAGDAGLVRDLDPQAADLEGYLFPDTYALPRGATAERVVRLMVARFREAFPPALRQAAAAEGLTVRQAVTLASLVEKETARPDERPLVAAVYRNRLRRHMLLQCDPTIIYALERAGTYDGNIHRRDLSLDSPYNTYRYPGLPPGPIASPGRPALEAAVHPADVGYLYFVSRNDGSHVFASTLREHNANVRKYQIRYFREKRSGK
jgi:UPF0755 protein